MGQLVESVLFYNKAIVHLSRSDIYNLTKTYSYKDLKALFKRDDLKVFYNNSHTTVGSQNGICFVDSVGLHELDIEEKIFSESKLHTHDRTQSRLIARKLAPYISEYRLPDHFSSQLAEQVKDDQFRQIAVIETLKYYNPGVEFDPRQIRFEVKYLDDRHFKIETNIDFQKFNKTNDQSPIF